MPRLVFATTATGVPGGAQGYEDAIASRAAAALAHLEPGWRVDRAVVRSLRSSLPGTRRLPVSRVARWAGRPRAALGRVFYPAGVLVHRTSLELPPAPFEVVTLHDLVAWRYPDESAPVAAAAAELRDAAAVVCVSRHTAEQASELLGVTDPVVVPNGIDGRFFDARPLAPDTLAGLGLPAPFVLHVGGASARKNLAGLAEAWRRLAATHPALHLALAGPPHPARDALFAGMPRTHLLGRLPDAVLPGLVAAAAALVVPSLDEGFGLPAVEGMAARVPVVAARAGALPEVVADAGVLVEPTGAALAEGLAYAVSGDPALAGLLARGRDRAAFFTWERSAAGHADVWTAVARAH